MYKPFLPYYWIESRAIVKHKKTGELMVIANVLYGFSKNPTYIHLYSKEIPSLPIAVYEYNEFLEEYSKTNKKRKVERFVKDIKNKYDELGKLKRFIIIEQPIEKRHYIISENTIENIKLEKKNGTD